MVLGEKFIQSGRESPEKFNLLVLSMPIYATSVMDVEEEGTNKFTRFMWGLLSSEGGPKLIFGTRSTLLPILTVTKYNIYWVTRPFFTGASLVDQRLLQFWEKHLKRNWVITNNLKNWKIHSYQISEGRRIRRFLHNVSVPTLSNTWTWQPRQTETDRHWD